tara:strand:+ start:302 stop:448 length:147 start_codon:yes stop_codon:yes gene_type:complete
MNFGTPQEIIDEERNYYNSIENKHPNNECLGFFISIFILVIGALIIAI